MSYPQFKWTMTKKVALNFLLKTLLEKIYFAWKKASLTLKFIKYLLMFVHDFFKEFSVISTATFSRETRITSREKRHKHCHFTFLGKTFLFASELKKSQLFAPFL